MDASQDIRQDQRAQRYVTSVLHRDRVRDHVVDRHVVGLVGFLRHRQLRINRQVEVQLQDGVGCCQSSRQRAYAFIIIQRVGLTIIGSLSLILVGCADGFADGAGPSFRHFVVFLILQVLVLIIELDSIVRLVQLEVGIVGMRFVDAVGVLGGSEECGFADMLRAIVNGPVVDDVGVGAGRGGGAGGRTRGSLHRFGSRSNRAHAGTIGSDGIVDGYFILFPDGEHGVVGMILVRSDLGSRLAVAQMVCAVALVVVEIGRCATLGPVGRILFPIQRLLQRDIAGISVDSDNNSCPTEELIPIACRRSRNVDPSVDCDVLILLERFAAVILIPIDMGGRGLLGVDVDSLQTNRIFLGISARRGILDVLHLCILFEHCERAARENGGPGIRPSAIHVFLHNPIPEDVVAVRRNGSRAGRRFGTIHIGVGVGRRARAAVCIIFNYDTGSAFQRGAPLGVDVQFGGDPETISSVVTSRIGVEIGSDQLTVTIIGIRHIDGLIIGGRDAGLVERIRLAVEHVRASGVQIPADELKAGQNAGGRADMTSLTDTEGHLLISRTPVDVTRGAFRIIYMQEDTVLPLTPLGVNRYAAFRHGIKVVFIRAGIIQVPAFKDVPGGMVCRHIVIEGRHVRAIGDASLSM